MVLVGTGFEIGYDLQPANQTGQALGGVECL
jgi:hypothetical protein